MAIDQNEILSLLNNSGLAKNLTNLKQALLQKALVGLVASAPLSPHMDDADKMRNFDKFLLNSVGPAAAEAAMDYAIGEVKSRHPVYQGVKFDGNLIQNIKFVQNDDAVAGCYPNFSSVLRQFLLPRYAYLDFDTITDPRHRIDEECGYPKFITPIMYRYMYDRDDMARRVVDIYSDECWAADLEVYETEEGRKDESKRTPFEKAWHALCDDYSLKQYLYRLDRLSGIGHYGALLLGVDDAADLERPIDEAELLAGMRKSVSKKQRGLMFMRPFDEYLSFIHQYETDTMHPRYGLAKMYNLVFVDMTIDAAGASVGTRLNRRVHWSRIVHSADNLQSSLVYGIPRMQGIFNRLLDLRKIKGGSAEMFWKGAFPGFAFEIDPQFVADDPEFNREDFKRSIEDYSNGLQRYLDLVGVKVNSMAPQVVSPTEHVRVQLEAIAIYLGIPFRIFTGSEEGRLASSQDKLTWNMRLNRKLRSWVEPGIVRNVIDRFVAIGIMPPPSSGRYFVDWADLNTPTDEDKANLALKYTQSLSQYVSTGMIHLIEPKDYLTAILGLSPPQASMIIQAVQSKGGFQKLLSVDPSQQGPGNTKSQDSDGKSSEKPAKRNTADKKSEGTAS